MVAAIESLDKDHSLRAAQIALEAYFGGRSDRRKCAAHSSWSEGDVVDLISDLLLFVRSIDCNEDVVIRKAQIAVEAAAIRFQLPFEPLPSTHGFEPTGVLGIILPDALLPPDAATIPEGAFNA